MIVQNRQLAGEKLNILDIFVLSSVLTILAIRGFLELTSYPQLGGDSLHIAHMLWGGFFMVGVLLFLLLSEKPNRYIASFVAGIGFGFFIDEIGKFITSDNDYFFKPTAMLIYMLLLLLWFSVRFIIVKVYSGSFLSPAEWPRARYQQHFILVYAAMNACLGLINAVGQLFFDDSVRMAPIVEMFVIIGSLLTAVLYAYGIFIYRHGSRLRSASIIRSSALITIAFVYPITFYQEQFSAVLGCILAISVGLGLSEASLKSIVQPLVNRK